LILLGRPTPPEQAIVAKLEAFHHLDSVVSGEVIDRVQGHIKHTGVGQFETEVRNYVDPRMSSAMAAYTTGELIQAAGR
jgi:hypothetical protein